jgi:hypothetical protein
MSLPDFVHGLQAIVLGGTLIFLYVWRHDL